MAGTPVRRTFSRLKSGSTRPAGATGSDRGRSGCAAAPPSRPADHPRTSDRIRGPGRLGRNAAERPGQSGAQECGVAGPFDPSQSKSGQSHAAAQVIVEGRGHVHLPRGGQRKIVQIAAPNRCEQPIDRAHRSAFARGSVQVIGERADHRVVREQGPRRPIRQEVRGLDRGRLVVHRLIIGRRRNLRNRRRARRRVLAGRSIAGCGLVVSGARTGGRKQHDAEQHAGQGRRAQRITRHGIRSRRDGSNPCVTCPCATCRRATW